MTHSTGEAIHPVTPEEIARGKTLDALSRLFKAETDPRRRAHMTNVIVRMIEAMSPLAKR